MLLGASEPALSRTVSEAGRIPFARQLDLHDGYGGIADSSNGSKGCWHRAEDQQQKDKEGERLIKLFSMPCKPTKSNGMRTRNLPEHYPADWEKFKYYCIQDVNTEVDIYNRLKRFPMPEKEWEHYRTNERINDRGVKIDTELVEQAIACDLMLSDAMSKKAYELTGLENPKFCISAQILAGGTRHPDGYSRERMCTDESVSWIRMAWTRRHWIC